MFSFFHSITSLATFSKAFIISLTKLSEDIKPKSSTKEKDRTKGLVFNSLLKSPLMYIKKKIGDTGES